MRSEGAGQAGTGASVKGEESMSQATGAVLKMLGIIIGCIVGAAGALVWLGDNYFVKKTEFASIASDLKLFSAEIGRLAQVTERVTNEQNGRANILLTMQNNQETLTKSVDGVVRQMSDLQTTTTRHEIDIAGMKTLIEGQKSSISALQTTVDHSVQSQANSARLLEEIRDAVKEKKPDPGDDKK